MSLSMICLRSDSRQTDAVKCVNDGRVKQKEVKRRNCDFKGKWKLESVRDVDDAWMTTFK